MTKKSSDSEKSKVKIKASAGAWWNSKVETDEKEKQDTVKALPKRERKLRTPSKVTQENKAIVPSEETKVTKKPTQPPKSSKAESSKSRSTSKNVAKTKARQASSKLTKTPMKKGAESKQAKASQKNVSDQVESLEPTVAQTSSVKKASPQVEVEKKEPKKPATPKRGRKPKAKVGSVAEENVVPKKDESEETAVASDSNSERVEKETNGEQTGAEKPRQQSRRNGRGRRRSRRNKKVTEATVNKQDATQTAVTEAEVTEELKTDSVELQEEKAPVEEKPKAIRLLINAEEPEECRLALLEDGRLESIHVSTVNRTQTKSNIYKATIVAIEPNLQAAFVDYGTPKNGFLPFSEIHPEYYKSDLSDDVLALVEAGQWKKLKIEDVVERGQELLVQVVKEEVGKKGANMTTYLSLPGRCVVLMPGSDSTGISRKISGELRRSQLRDIMHSIEIPEGIGWIVRTASVDLTEVALSRDVGYLLKLWEDIRSKGQDIEGVGLVYEDHRSVMRFLREYFDPSIQEILVDDKAALDQVNEFIEMLPSQQKDVKVRLHRGSRPIFNQFSVEDQIESIYQPQVNLPSGGSIVIDPTEALVAIDVNSGSTSKGKNFEESIYQANMEAAAELARQLRLRDLGGLVVVDFIDMRNRKHVRDVEKQVKVSMKRDKAKVDFSRISKFGLLQISRQKLGSPIEAGNYRVCEHCKGRGAVRSVETLALFYLRRIQTGASRNPVVKIECKLPLDVASYLLNNKRQELYELENKYKVEILIIADSRLKPADNEIVFHKQEKEQEDKK